MNEQFDPNTIPTLGKSTLLGYKYRLVGFLYVGILPTPTQITLFHQQSDKSLYLICMSDVTKKQKKSFAKILKHQLGSIHGSDEVIPYVQRSIGGANYEEFKAAIEVGFPKTRIEWWDGI